MQTFLPYADFADSAHALDQRRLGKQRVETYQIMKALILPEESRWVSHPATRMWRGYEFTLLLYQQAVCEEWVVECGFKDTCFDKTLKLYFENYKGALDMEDPPWLGDEKFHRSHQSNLLRKDPGYYRKQFPGGLSSTLPYIWPV